MKTLLVVLSVLIISTGCSYNTAQNHKGIREWKAGKMAKSNRRPNERPQCIDSW